MGNHQVGLCEIHSEIDPLMRLLIGTARLESCRFSTTVHPENVRDHNSPFGNNNNAFLQWLSSDLRERRRNVSKQLNRSSIRASNERLSCHRSCSISPHLRPLLEADVRILLPLVKVDFPIMGVGLLKHDWRLSVIVSSVAQMYSSPHLTLGVISPRVGVTPRYLGRLFHQYTGVPFHRYLRALRIATSADWLCSNLGPIKQAAADCGYSSGNNFIRDFIEETGLSPTAYRSLRRFVSTCSGGKIHCQD